MSYGGLKGTYGGPSHCIRTPDCPLKLSHYPALYLRNCMLFKIDVGIVHFRPQDVPLNFQLTWPF